MRIQTLLKTFAALAALGLCGVAQAVTLTYQLNNGGSAFSGLTSWGTVTVSDAATNKVAFDVKLTSGYYFVDTGSHEYFSFNPGVTVSLQSGGTFLNPTSTNLTLSTNPGTNSPFSSFQDAIVCSSCSGNNQRGTELTFSITGSGLNANSFARLSTGSGIAAYFAADIIGPSSPNDCVTTGVVGATRGGVSVPEPATLGLLGLGLVGVGFARRRKVAA